MKALFIFMSVCIVNFCYAQSDIQDYRLKDIHSTYVADVVIKKKVFSGSCGCIFIDSHSQCNLYEGFIDLIRFLPENPTVFDSLSLQNMRYFVLESNRLLMPDSVYTVTLSPGTAGSYLKISNILQIDPNKKYRFISNNVYLSGFLSCYKIGFLNRLFLLLGIIEAEDINYKNKRKKKDKFDEFISNRQ